VTLRQRLGAAVPRVHEQVDELLDSQDGLILLVDGQRAVSYAQGFGLSPAQLELLACDVERAIREVTRAHLAHHGRRDREEEGARVDGRRRPRGHGRGYRGRVADGRCDSTRPADPGGGTARIGTGRVFRMADKLAAPDPD
jgi:hypothetical protein